jgi:tryptophan synthase alpha chain
MLTDALRTRLGQREILLMTHIVIGYPTLDDSLRMIDTMVAAGVDLMELQIPFSEPMADGPVILRANQRALANGVRVADCLELAETAANRFDIPFVFMTYANIPHKFGLTRFTARMADIGLQGAIIPDLPPEEAGDYLAAMDRRKLAPIFIYAPTTSAARMAQIAQFARGFVYCVARKGVTGQETDFTTRLDAYLARCRQATDLPLAVGFGVQSRADVDFLKGKADIAVVGTQAIRQMDAGGVAAVGDFVAGLR